MIVILSGAGMSAESGISTFRGQNGLWENHDIIDVASPQGWDKDPHLVNRFYNARRAQLNEVKPNLGHLALKKLEHRYEVQVITQNVDDLHERAGSTNVLHLHGELRKVRSTKDESYILNWTEDLSLSDCDPQGHPLRPHIVWFGEAVPTLDKAIQLLVQADVVIIVGTSMQVYPAASLVQYASADAKCYYIDPKPSINHELQQRTKLEILKGTAGQILPQLVEQLLDK